MKVVIVGGGNSRFRGSQGSSVLKLFGLTAASTGINEKAAQAAGIAYDKVVLFPPSHATYYPGAQSMAMKLLYERESLRLLRRGLRPAPRRQRNAAGCPYRGGISARSSGRLPQYSAGRPA